MELLNTKPGLPAAYKKIPQNRALTRKKDQTKFLAQ
jgi:hypothetical protein